jgi:hypothetical protein
MLVKLLCIDQLSVILSRRAIDSNPFILSRRASHQQSLTTTRFFEAPYLKFDYDTGALCGEYGIIEISNADGGVVE